MSVTHVGVKTTVFGYLSFDARFFSCMLAEPAMDDPSESDEGNVLYTLRVCGVIS